MRQSIFIDYRSINLWCNLQHISFSERSLMSRSFLGWDTSIFIDYRSINLWCNLQRISFGALSDVTVVLVMRQRILIDYRSICRSVNANVYQSLLQLTVVGLTGQSGACALFPAAVEASRITCAHVPIQCRDMEAICASEILLKRAHAGNTVVMVSMYFVSLIAIPFFSLQSLWWITIIYSITNTYEHNNTKSLYWNMKCIHYNTS